MIKAKTHGRDNMEEETEAEPGRSRVLCFFQLAKFFFSCISQNYCPKIAQPTVACTLPQQTSLSSREDSKESIMIWGKRRSRIRIL